MNCGISSSPATARRSLAAISRISRPDVTPDQARIPNADLTLRAEPVGETLLGEVPARVADLVHIAALAYAADQQVPGWPRGRLRAALAAADDTPDSSRRHGILDARERAVESGYNPGVAYRRRLGV